MIHRPLSLGGFGSNRTSPYKQSSIAAFVLAFLAGTQFFAPDLFDTLSVATDYGSLAVLPAFGRWGRRESRVLRHLPADAILLVGDDPDLSIVAAALAARGRRVMRCESVDEAMRVSRGIRCSDAIVGIAPLPPDVHLVDARGRTIDVVPVRHVVERLLGRVRIDPTITTDLSASEITQPLGHWHYAKRIVDLMMAVLLSVLLLPATVFVALALWLAGQRPVIQRTQRVGQHGRGFDIFQFNVLSVPPRWKNPSEDGTPTPTARRIIRGHQLLKHARLDLGPALWNVIRGEMSLVGPRPISPEGAEQHPDMAPLFRQRHSVKPGLVSLARVRFRYSDTERDTRLALEYDLYYVKHWSPALDMRIVGRGCWQLLREWHRAVVLTVNRRLAQSARHVAAWRARVVHPSALASVALPRDLVDGGRSVKMTLIVGAGQDGKHLSRELRRCPTWGLWPVAFVDDDPVKFGCRINGVPVLGDTAALGALVQREQIHTVVIAIPSASEEVIMRIADIARSTGARVLSMPDIGSVLRGGSALALQSVPIADILGRPTVEPDIERCRAFLRGKRVLVTGAAGSIGREVMRQVAQSEPAAIFALDINESDLFDLEHDLLTASPNVPITSIVTSITDEDAIRAVLERYRPEIIFHAAAYKHVPLMEKHPSIAIRTNTIATYHLARHAAATGVQRFVLVSTDKAVRPSSVMGASKRLAELAVRDVARETGLSACAVRFGNVLCSRGSVIPLFQKQIEAGGPVKVTDERMMRYFMTIPEAAGLIIQAGAFGHTDVIYMLDMGEEVAIRELAERLIRSRGLSVGDDIDIVYTGVRSGEKLRESLAHDFEMARPTAHPKIRILSDAHDASARAKSIASIIRSLSEIARWRNEDDIRMALMRSVQTAEDLVVDDASNPSRAADLTHGGSLLALPETVLSQGAGIVDDREHDWRIDPACATIN